MGGADGRGRSLIEKYVFDRSGRLLEDRHEIAVSADAATEPVRFQVFRNVYQSNGRDYETDDFEIEPTKGEKPIDLQRHFVKFDSVGRCIEETTVDSDGSLDLKMTYEYDSQGNPINEVYHNADCTASSVERTYGLGHRLSSEKNIGWSTNSSRAYRYDARGNRTDEFDYEQGVLEVHRIYQYDDRNRLISSEAVVDPDKDQHVYGRCGDCGPSSGKTIYTYDSARRLIESRMFEPGGQACKCYQEFL